MTNEAIRLVLERPNRGMHEDIIITPISKTVWWGYIWGETDQGYEPEGYIQEQGFEFFFVKARDKNLLRQCFAWAQMKSTGMWLKNIVEREFWFNRSRK